MVHACLLETECGDTVAAAGCDPPGAAAGWDVWQRVGVRVQKKGAEEQVRTREAERGRRRT
eukprot:1024217-Alexandrium_andersonii.AAC.1